MTRPLISLTDADGAGLILVSSGDEAISPASCSPSSAVSVEIDSLLTSASAPSPSSPSDPSFFSLPAESPSPDAAPMRVASSPLVQVEVTNRFPPSDA